MKKAFGNYFLFVSLFCVIFTLLLPVFVYANGEQPSEPAEGISPALPNPLGPITDPRDVVGNIIKAILGIVGSLALAVFIFGGFTWVTSGGNEEKVKKGKDMIVWASLGLAVIFASYALIQFVLKAITGE